MTTLTHCEFVTKLCDTNSVTLISVTLISVTRMCNETFDVTSMRLYTGAPFRNANE